MIKAMIIRHVFIIAILSRLACGVVIENEKSNESEDDASAVDPVPERVLDGKKKDYESWKRDLMRMKKMLQNKKKWGDADSEY